MIVTATSAANQCLYCVVAHGALLRIYEKKPRPNPGSSIAEQQKKKRLL